MQNMHRYYFGFHNSLETSCREIKRTECPNEAITSCLQNRVEGWYFHSVNIKVPNRYLSYLWVWLALLLQKIFHCLDIMVSHLLNFLDFHGIIQAKSINQALQISLSIFREAWNLRNFRNLRKFWQPFHLQKKRDFWLRFCLKFMKAEATVRQRKK